MRYVSAFAIAVLLGGCAGHAPSSTFVPASRSFSDSMKGPSSTTKLFLTDQYDGYVLIVDAQGHTLGKVTGVSPNDAAIDASSNLWVADGTNYRIVKFAPPYTSPALTLRDTAGQPVTIAVETAPGPQQGLVAVSSIPTAGYATLRFYAPSHTYPCKTLVLPSSPISYMNFDARGTLYGIGYYHIERIGRGCDATRVENLKTGNHLSPGSLNGLGIAPNGSIVVLSAGYSTSTLYAYAPPVNGNLGNPIQTVAIPLGNAGPFVMSAGGNDLWMLDRRNNQVDEYTYPAGKQVTSFADSFNDYTISVSPPVIPQ